MKVILVNPQAKRLRENGDIGKLIQAKYSSVATVICPENSGIAVAKLCELESVYGISEIYVVGGDGTFNRVMNWTIRRPKNRPVIMSVGGGEMCYFARAQGLTSSDPLKNLEEIFSGVLSLEKTSWRPVKITNAQTKDFRYAGIIANGVVSDFVEWYENVGKGDFRKVIWMIFIGALSVLFDFVRKAHGRLSHAEGKLSLNHTPFATRHLAFISSTINEILPTCRPFRGKIDGVNFFNITDARGFKRLALSVPFIWFGKYPHSPRSRFYNHPIAALHYTTIDARFVIDGDLVDWSAKDSECLFSIIKGPEVTLHTVRN